MRIRDEIAALLELGLSHSEIARRLGLAAPTVAYHHSRIVADGTRALVSDPPWMTCEVGAVVRQVRTRDEVARLLAQGLGKLAIARTLGISRGTVSYHARRLGTPVDVRGARRYDWQAIQAFYDAGHSVRECQERFGFSRHSWHAAMRRGAIVPRPQALAIDDLCRAATPRGRHNLKRRLLAAGVKQARCELCGLAEWRGQPLALALHHVNGDRHDNRLENLQLLCPNCHSQTDTFAGRSWRRRSPAAPAS